MWCCCSEGLRSHWGPEHGLSTPSPLVKVSKLGRRGPSQPASQPAKCFSAEGSCRHECNVDEQAMERMAGAARKRGWSVGFLLCSGLRLGGRDLLGLN